MDSSDMTIVDWARIATQIEVNIRTIKLVTCMKIDFQVVITNQTALCTCLFAITANINIFSRNVVIYFN